MISQKIYSILFFILVGGAVAQAQNEVCSLTTYFWDNASKFSSSRSLVGKFPLKFEDETVSKIFEHQESGVAVYVGAARIAGMSKKDSRKLRIALSFQSKLGVFDDVDRAEAETLYDSAWRWLSVSKSLEVENRVYTFSFSCEREKKRR